MKEVKEQCEERIEEVTKKGNEAIASRNLSEKKDQSQQVILGFCYPGFEKASLLSLQALCSLICWFPLSLLLLMGLVPWDTAASPGVLQLWQGPVLEFRALPGLLPLKSAATLGEHHCYFEDPDTHKAPATSWSVVGLMSTHTGRVCDAWPMKLLLKAFRKSMCWF